MLTVASGHFAHPPSDFMRFAYLDGIRGMAALFVLARHWDELFRFDFYQSYLAVDLFFMLSGFVIAHAYDRKLRSGALSPGSFMRLRFARLYPVYALAVVICAAYFLARTVSHGGPAALVFEWLVATTMALCFVPFTVTGSAVLFSVNVCFWSLSQEMLVNLLYAYTRRSVSNRMLMAIVALAGAGLVALAIATGTIGHGYMRGATSFFGGFLRAVFGIGLGMLLYRHRERLAPIACQLPAWFSFPLVAVLLMAPQLPGYPWLVHVVGVFVVLPAAIIMATHGEPARGWPSRAMEALGVASYPLYLLHVPFGHLVRRAAAGLEDWSVLVATAMALLLFFLCLQLDKHFDTPVRTWLRARLQRGGGTATPSPA